MSSIGTTPASETPITTPNGEIRQTSTTPPAGNTTVSVRSGGDMFLRVDPQRDTREEGIGRAAQMVGTGDDTVVRVLADGRVLVPGGGACVTPSGGLPGLTPEQIARLGNVEQIQALGATLAEGGSLSREDISAASLFALNAGNIAACRDTTPETPAR